MKKVRFNSGWEFTFENNLDEFTTFGFDKYSDAAGASARFYDYSNWERVDLPHDWSLSLERTTDANCFAGAYPNTRYHRFKSERHSDVPEVYNIGWYRKQFRLDPSWEGKRIFVEFEGIFRDSVIWVNGVYLDRHTSGYTSFALELTDHLIFGEDNSIAVRVDSEQAEGWWYEGAGIYRNVNLLIGEPVYIKYNGIAVKADIDGKVNASVVLVNDTEAHVTKSVSFTVKDSNGNAVAVVEKKVDIAPYGEIKAEAALTVSNPDLWSVDTPYLYGLTVECEAEAASVNFGIRSVGFDADRGFILNGKTLKIRGACVHQDFGGVGVALTDDLQEYKIKRLKEMGVNAYRSAHHAPAPALLDACDRLGMLVMDETRTFGTSPEAIRQLTDLMERDRNHPSVFIWSLGNEEFSIQNEAWSYRLMEKMTRIAKSLDDTRPVTYGGNNGSNYIGANGASEIRGVNYIRNDKNGYWLDEYHKAHPEQPIIGTEESSYVLSRGGAANRFGDGLLDSCGGVTMSWGSTPKGWVKFFELRDYLAGSFMWTGFDYRGEPNPFYYSNVASSFGTIDLCGMEKPPFYYYKAWWTDEPVLKLTPHWNHKEGETVTVYAFTNCPEISLYLNGRLIETKKVERFDSPSFTLPFEAGELLVQGLTDGELLTDSLITSAECGAVWCECVHEAEDTDGISIYEFTAIDENGTFCPLASDLLEISVTGGKIVGVGNGDPSDIGRERAAVYDETVDIRSFEYEYGCYFVPEKAKNALGSRHDYFELESKRDDYEDDFRLVAAFKKNLTPAREFTYTATVNLIHGMEYIEFQRLGSDCEVYLNGEKLGDNRRWHGRQCKNQNRPYRFYGDFKKGENVITVVATQQETDAAPISGYARIGRNVEAPWRVKLHYGKARAFIKPVGDDGFSVTATIL